MLKSFILLLWTCSFGFAQESVSVLEDEKIEIVDGRELIAQKRYADAVSLFTKLINKKPDNFSAYVLRSKAKYGLKDYRGALEDSKYVVDNKASADSVSVQLATLNVGICYNNLGNFEQGISYLKTARTLDSTDKSICFSLAYSYLELNQLDSAYAELENLLKIDAKDKRGYYGKGKVLFLKKQYQEAIAEFDKAIALDPNYVMAYQNRGESKRILGDKMGCCQDWGKCVELGLVSVKPYLKKVCR